MTLIAHRTIDFRLNGRDVSVRADHPHLLSALREELDITSAKDGCAPSGQCGCCTVLVNGRAFVACVLALEKVAGKEVVTLEGFDPVQRDRLASAFAVSGALQCGFCTPGILVRTKALIDLKGSGLTKRVTAGRLGAHLCRCTGYTKIFDAIEMLARGEIPPLETSGGIGKSGIKYEGYELALGDRDYIDDIRFDGHPPRRPAAHGPRQGGHPEDRHRARRSHTGRARRVHRGRRGGRVAGGADPQGLAGTDTRGWADLLLRRRAGDRGGRRPVDSPRGGRGHRGRVPRPETVHRPCRGSGLRGGRGVGSRRQRPLGLQVR